MKAKLILIISICALPILSKAQYLQSNTSSTYFFNSNQAMPVFAGNEGNWRVQVTSNIDHALISDFKQRTNTQLVSIDGYLPKIKSAVYINGTSSRLGYLNASQLNAGISPRFKVNQNWTIVLNAGINHQTFRSFLADDFQLKSNYLNAEIGGSIIYKTIYAAIAHQNMFGSYAYLWDAKLPEDYNPKRGRLRSNTRFIFGKNLKVNEDLLFNGTLAFNSNRKNYLIGSAAVNITAEYKWLLAALTYDSNDDFNLAIGCHLKQRIKAAYSVGFNFSPIMVGAAIRHQIGISYNITKPNTDHQLLPLLSMF